MSPGIGSSEGRGISPVIGAILMLGIVLLLAGACTVMLLSFSDELPESTAFFVEDNCPGFHVAEYETGEFSEFVEMIRENNCALWLRNGEVRTDGDGRVSQWNDLGPHGFHASQSKSGDRPNLTDDGIDDVLDFEADHGGESNDGQYLRLSRDVEDLDLAADAGIAVAAVLKADVFERNGVWTIGETGETGREFSLRTCSEGEEFYDGCAVDNDFDDATGWWRAQNWEDSDVDFHTGNGSKGEWLVILQAYDGEEVIIRVNGEEVERKEADLDLSANRDIQIGRWEREDESWYFEGSIAEIMIFDRALEDGDVELLEEYLAHQYGDHVEMNGPIDE